MTIEKAKNEWPDPSPWWKEALLLLMMHLSLCEDDLEDKSDVYMQSKQVN